MRGIFLFLNKCIKIHAFIDTIKTKKTSDTVFIIGGGPSLNQYLPDRSLLDNKDVIAGNNAYLAFPKAMMLHFADKTWFYWHQKQLKEFKQPISTCSRGDLYSNVEYDRSGISVFIHDNKKGGISTVSNKLDGNNTGHHCVNIAYHLGYKNVILLGFDMDANSSKTHWHDGHNRVTNKNNYKGTMLPGMEEIAKFCKKTNDFKVYNVNIESAIKCFEYTEIEKWL